MTGYGNTQIIKLTDASPDTGMRNDWKESLTDKEAAYTHRSPRHPAATGWETDDAHARDNCNIKSVNKLGEVIDFRGSVT